MGSAANDLTVAASKAIAAAGRVSADGNGTGVDVTDFEGWGTLEVSASFVSGSASPTYDGKLQESDTSGGTYTDVAGAAITQLGGSGSTLQKLGVNWSATKAFVRWVDDVAGTSPVYDRCVIAKGAPKAYSPS